MSSTSDPQPKGSLGDPPAPMRRLQIARITTIRLYEVTEEELSNLERGSSVNVEVTFSASLYTAAGSLLFAVLTSEISAAWIRLAFYTVIVTGFVYGTHFAILAKRNRSRTTTVSQRIRKRAAQNTDDAD